MDWSNQLPTSTSATALNDGVSVRFGATFGFFVPASGATASWEFSVANGGDAAAVEVEYNDYVYADVSQYCPAGSAAPNAAGPGVYTTPVVDGVLRTAEAECDAGNFCVGGEKTPCAAGKYQDDTGASECNPCAAGTYSGVAGRSDECDACAGAEFCPEGPSRAGVWKTCCWVLCGGLQNAHNPID